MAWLSSCSTSVEGVLTIVVELSSLLWKELATRAKVGVFSSVSFVKSFSKSWGPRLARRKASWLLRTSFMRVWRTFDDAGLCVIFLHFPSTWIVQDNSSGNPGGLPNVKLWSINLAVIRRCPNQAVHLLLKVSRSLCIQTQTLAGIWHFTCHNFKLSGNTNFEIESLEL